MVPILNGATGVVLLTFSIGLGVYVRQVYATTLDTYDQTFAEENPTLWPLNASYTQARLKNLEEVLRSLRIVTTLMFVFCFLVCARLIAFALNATPLTWAHTGNVFLTWVDLFLIIYLSIAFVVSYWAHLVGANRERENHDAAHAALSAKREPPPQLN